MQEDCQMGENKVSLFLDSGAYSAWSQGVEINIQDYIKFIKKHKDVIEVYANLDVIGSAEKTWQNQLIMEEAGLKPLPVFHTTLEKDEWLIKYLKRGYDYIALGGTVGGSISTLEIRLRLDQLFQKYICDSSGMPKVKVHGFGLTAHQLLLRYPWYSVDSTSWVLIGRMGGVLVPRFRQGKYTYDKNCWKISVSNKSPDTKEAGQHIETLPPMQKQVILNYIHSKGYKLGKSEFKKVSQTHKLRQGEKWADNKPKAKDKTSKRLLEIIHERGLCNDYKLRDELNIIYFLDLEKSLPEWPWPFKIKVRKGFGL